MKHHNMHLQYNAGLQQKTEFSQFVSHAVQGAKADIYNVIQYPVILKLFSFIPMGGCFTCPSVESEQQNDNNIFK